MLEITKVDNPNLDSYKEQKNVRRMQRAVGGFEYIVYATDQDLDGMHIRGLLNGFIERYLPEFKERVGMLQTPVILYTNGKEITGWKYSLEDTTEYKGTPTYVKGIGSWNSDDLKFIIKQEGLEKMVDMVDFQGEYGKQLIEQWLGDDPTPRKKAIVENDFEIAKI